MSPVARRPMKKSGALRGVRANAGLEAVYRKRLLCLVDAMQASVEYWLKSAYRKNEPAIIAMDATPAAELQKAIRRMVRQWQKNFNEGAEELARFFARSVRSRSDRQLMAILKKAGFTVRFTTTPAMRDVMRATVEQNVQLIKSIPQQYLTQVQGAVMRSVQTGRDLGSLSAELRQQFGVTRKRAALISLDQNNKATSAMVKVRQMELGIEKGIWRHSHAGKEPRPTHLANDGKLFSVSRGWFDPDPKVRRHIMPGELIRCRCFWQPVVEGFGT
jgi:uncharacterized protein with gpF-like domain